MIDSHIILTVYDKSDWLNNLVKPAIKEENKGNVGIFYLNKKKAENYTAFSQLKGNVDSAFIHNITDSGSPVNDNYKKQTDTLQFKHWFGNSIMTEDGRAGGKPKVLFYHGQFSPLGKTYFSTS